VAVPRNTTARALMQPGPCSDADDVQRGGGPGGAAAPRASSVTRIDMPAVALQLQNCAGIYAFATDMKRVGIENRGVAVAGAPATTCADDKHMIILRKGFEQKLFNGCCADSTSAVAHSGNAAGSLPAEGARSVCRLSASS
jgi:hypothetical protein